MKKTIVIVLALVIVLSMSSMVFAGNMDSDVISDLQGGNKSVLGKGVMNTVAGLSVDIFNIVRYIVVAILVIKLVMSLQQFSAAGDNPALKASLKKTLLWTGAGLVLVLNFWSIYSFIKSINLGLGA